MKPENSEWLASLSAFFDQRGAAVAGAPTLEDLCYIAGRDPRIWRDEQTCRELADSILSLTNADETSSIFEVGCAAGFLAYLVAPRVRKFTGVDLAAGALTVARRLGLANAEFQQADGGALPFPDASFDAAFCYDVFTNFPSIEGGIPLIGEMMRIVRPGGRVLVGNVPDRLRAADLPARVQEIAAELEARHGPYVPRPIPEPEAISVPVPVPAPTRSAGLWARLFGGQAAAPQPVAPQPSEPEVTPAIVTYDFLREDFVAVGERLGAKVELAEVHEKNPYRGFRFNVAFSREA